MRITVDPDTNASGFGYVSAGRYRLRVVKATNEQGPQAPYIKWEFEFADPNVRSCINDRSGQPLNLGHIFENTTLARGKNSQFRLRQLCESLGLQWGDFDSETTYGMEFDAEVIIDEYNGKFSNKVKTFIPKP